ncbi:MAG: hypothetical protein NTV70_12215, partial [Acidobacteria bacterium]|nr:hypothetical protein [Acidobacteriota bacterium]
EWDFSGNNQAYVLGTPQMRRNMSGAVGSNIAVRLRITDNSVPALSAEFTGFIRIASPPTPPTANPAGPYSFCTNTRTNGTLIYTPFMLDGSRSSNPDDGKFEPLPIGNPPSALVLYEWFLNPAAPNTVSFSGGPAASQVRVDGAPFNFQTRSGQSFNVALRVTNNDQLSFPTAGLAAGLSNTALASVFVRPATDPECTHCVADLRSNAKGAAPGRPGNVQLYWTDKDNALFPIDHYNIYRSTSPTFASFTQIAGANGTAPAVKVRRLQVPTPPTTTLFFQDNAVTAGTTYYYRVTPATLNDSETCQSNVTLQVAVPIVR